MSISDVFIESSSDVPWASCDAKHRFLSVDEQLTNSYSGECWDTSPIPVLTKSHLRASLRLQDPFRRHSWEPGKHMQDDADYDQRSVSLEGLDPDEIEKTYGVKTSICKQDPRRAPIHSTADLESLLLLEEDLQLVDDPRVFLQKGYLSQMHHAKRLQAYSASEPSICAFVQKSDTGRLRIQDPDEISLWSLKTGLADSQSLLNVGSSEDLEWEDKKESALERTLSFFKKKMAGKSKFCVPDVVA
ncbi:A-kinase anchor protein 13-like [Protopterus annectens]|uniref:A-kinase anchor protein 13-like n=1 Tax=Protopterus annectens TaxID=7888 RepID=UPI001CF9BA9F|nr:A-kinase anchor protein 13-like [Protopterus annectens]